MLKCSHERLLGRDWRQGMHVMASTQGHACHGMDTRHVFVERTQRSAVSNREGGKTFAGAVAQPDVFENQHTASALPVHLRWVAALEEEFFRQGDAERAAGMTISPLFDRNKQGISKSQVGACQLSGGLIETACIPLSPCRHVTEYMHDWHI
eukprot:scaffold43076_cov26-Tisochrysis_lutea.AAC.1